MKNFLYFYLIKIFYDLVFFRMNPDPLNWPSEYVLKEGILENTKWRYTSNRFVPGRTYSVQIGMTVENVEENITSSVVTYNPPPPGKNYYFFSFNPFPTAPLIIYVLVPICMPCCLEGVNLDFMIC